MSYLNKKFTDIISNLKSIGPKDHPNKYSIAKKLGQGSFGAVYIGYDNDNKSIAIKFQQVKKDYEKETRCLKYIQKVCGKYILCYIDDFITMIEDVTIYCIITEYVSGYKVLSQFIQENEPLSKPTITTIVKHMIIALEKIHTIRVEHMDLHEDNILIHPETLDIKLIDFGRCYIFEYESQPDDIFEPDEDEAVLHVIKRQLEKMSNINY